MHILIPLGIFAFCGLVAYIIRNYRKNKANSNLINDNIDIKANLIPEETQEIQEIKEPQETHEPQEENKQ